MSHFIIIRSLFNNSENLEREIIATVYQHYFKLNGRVNREHIENMNRIQQSKVPKSAKNKRKKLKSRTEDHSYRKPSFTKPSKYPLNSKVPDEIIMSEDFRKAETAKNFKELNLQGKTIVLRISYLVDVYECIFSSLKLSTFSTYLYMKSNQNLV